MVYAAIIAAAIIADQLTKWWAVSELMTLPGRTIPIIQDVFHFTYAENTGGAFSIFSNSTLILTIVSIIMALVLTGALVIKRNSLSKCIKIALALLIGGAIGNIIDRVALGYVVDFIDFRIINFAVFNVSDICVVCGAALLAFAVLMEERKERKNEAA